MKKAEVQILAFEYSCPHCGKLQEDENGSTMMDAVSFPFYVKPAWCMFCKKEFVLPTLVKLDGF